ncbi:ParB/RepB/Spo0J family partition protein [Leptolyngbya sp. PL-A3]|uniref:ParB/RepB/Spo0J family partition protein n=1 Tax=Leptolyngbya sp. PL-A3 TaxID=2933911 RepID=UPI0032973002
MAVRKRASVPQMRGVEAFLSQTTETPAGESGQNAPLSVAVKQIVLPTSQPRRYFDPDKLAQLAESIRLHGILEPLLVRPLKKEGQYELVAGERRYKASQIAGLKEVPVTIRELSDQDAWQLTLVENLQREDLNPIEETEGVLELLTLRLGCERSEIYDALTQMATVQKKGGELSGNVSRRLEEIEKILNVTIGLTPESFRTSRLPLLGLPSDVLEVMRQGKLEYTKARVIARIKDEAQREELLNQAISENLPLSEIKTRIKDLQAETKLEPTPEKAIAQQWSEIGKRLQKGKLLEDRKKRDRIQKLLDELDKLTSL